MENIYRIHCSLNAKAAIEFLFAFILSNHVFLGAFQQCFYYIKCQSPLQDDLPGHLDTFFTDLMVMSGNLLIQRCVDQLLPESLSQALIIRSSSWKCFGECMSLTGSLIWPTLICPLFVCTVWSALASLLALQKHRLNLPLWFVLKFIFSIRTYCKQLLQWRLWYTCDVLRN